MIVYSFDCQTTKRLTCIWLKINTIKLLGN